MTLAATAPPHLPACRSPTWVARTCYNHLPAAYYLAGPHGTTPTAAFSAFTLRHLPPPHYHGTALPPRAWTVSGNTHAFSPAHHWDIIPLLPPFAAAARTACVPAARHLARAALPLPDLLVCNTLHPFPVWIYLQCTRVITATHRYPLPTCTYRSPACACDAFTFIPNMPADLRPACRTLLAGTCHAYYVLRAAPCRLPHRAPEPDAAVAALLRPAFARYGYSNTARTNVGRTPALHTAV